jgi:hypothetical protein
LSKKKKNKIASAWVAHSLELRKSPAWRYLPDNARRLLGRLELEHMEHGGADNGRLIVTYSDWVEDGLRRASIFLAIQQSVELGFLEVTHEGGRSISEFRWPSHYRLTYVVNRENKPERTDEWRRIATDSEAESALARAEELVKAHRIQARANIQKAGRENVTAAVPKTLPSARVA